LVSNKHKLVKGKPDSVHTDTSKCQMNELKIIMERLDKHENKINEQKIQIDHIISEIF